MAAKVTVSHAPFPHCSYTLAWQTILKVSKAQNMPCWLMSLLYDLAYIIPSAWIVCIKTPTHSSNFNSNVISFSNLLFSICSQFTLHISMRAAYLVLQNDLLCQYASLRSPPILEIMDCMYISMAYSARPKVRRHGRDKGMKEGRETRKILKRNEGGKICFKS